MWDRQIGRAISAAQMNRCRIESGRAPAVGVVGRDGRARLACCLPAQPGRDGIGRRSWWRRCILRARSLSERPASRSGARPRSFWSVPSVAPRRGCRRLGPARASFGRTPRGDSASSFQPNRWPSRDFFIAQLADQPSRVHFPEIEPGCGRRAYPRASMGRGTLFTTIAHRARTRVHPARSWCPGASRRPVSRTRSNTGRKPQPSLLIPPIITDDYDGQTDDEGRIRKRMPKTSRLGPFRGTAARSPGTVPLRSL